MLLGGIRLLSVFFQVVAVLFAVRLVRVTGRRLAWMLITSAIVLMAFQRALTFADVLFSGDDNEVGELAEYLAFYISVLLCAGLAAIHELISRLHGTRRALAESERKYRTLVNHQPMSVFLKDTRLRYLSCNTGYAESLSIAEADVAGRTDFDFYPAEQAARVRQADALVLESGETSTAEESWTDDGRIMEVIRTPLHGEEGGVDGLLVTMRDVTERRQAEQARRELERQMQETQRLEGIGMLTGGIAHDFNNLLTGVLGNTYLLLQDHPDDSAVRASIKEIEAAAERAAHITNQMLAYSGQGRYAVDRMNLTSLIGDLDELLRASVSKRATLVFELADPLPDVEADASQIQQVMLNLLANASESLGDKAGTIAVRTGVRELGLDDIKQSAVHGEALPGLYAFVEVEDSGCGISEEDQGRVFEPFFSSKFAGRGLGLSAVQGIARGHRGVLSLQSREGEGTVLRFLLPAVPGDALAPVTKVVDADDSVETTWKAEGCVLLVDDEQTVRLVARRLLELAGFSVLTACDGTEAVEILQRHMEEIHVVLLDLSMPRLDGPEALDALRAVRPEVPVVISSAYKEQNVVTQFQNRSIQGFVQKPYNYNRLCEVLCLAIRSGSPT